MPLNPLVLGVGVLCFCICIITIIYFATQGGGGSPSPDAGSPGPVPAPVSARQALLNSGTAVQVSAVDPSTLSGNWGASIVPPAVSGTSKTYSFTMDIQVSSAWPTVGGDWYKIFSNGGNSPAFGINNGGGPGQSWWESNGVTILQSTAAGNQNFQVYSGSILVPGQWVTITFVCDGTNVNLYVNGILNSTITGKSDRTNTSGINWISSPAWKWEGLTGGGPTPTGKCQIKNFYWWSNKVLTAAEISTLTASASPGTSTYLPEPYDDSSDTAFY